jgi:hypothetical protein
MSAGLPATGLGGALYLLLIVWMLVRELNRSRPVPRSAPSRWPFIRKMLLILFVMVVVLVGERFLIHALLEATVSYVPGLARNARLPSDSFVILMAAMPFILLLLLMAGLHVLRLSLPTKPEAPSVDLANAGQSP